MFSLWTGCFFLLKVLVTSQSDNEIKTRDKSSKSSSMETTGAFNLAAVRSALVEWKVDLGGKFNDEILFQFEIWII